MLWLKNKEVIFCYALLTKVLNVENPFIMSLDNVVNICPIIRLGRDMLIF